MDKTFAIRDLRYMINKDPKQVVSNGRNPILGMVSRLDSKALAAAAGMQAQYIKSVHTVAYDWIMPVNEVETYTPPVVEGVVTVDGLEMRVLATVLDCMDVGLRLDLGAKYQ